MGEVDRARDHRLDRDVALKIVSEKLAGDSATLARDVIEDELFENDPHHQESYAGSGEAPNA